MSNKEDTLVLVADDEPSMLQLLSAYVRSKGYRVLEASDGDLAWQLAREHLPDIVVLDVMMPGMSGWEVCKKIRESISLSHTGVIMLTGIGESLNEMTSPLYGADAYIDKPFEFSELEARITETLERRQESQDLDEEDENTDDADEEDDFDDGEDSDDADEEDDFDDEDEIDEDEDEDDGDEDTDEDEIEAAEPVPVKRSARGTRAKRTVAADEDDPVTELFLRSDEFGTEDDDAAPARSPQITSKKRRSKKKVTKKNLGIADSEDVMNDILDETSEDSIDVSSPKRGRKKASKKRAAKKVAARAGKKASKKVAARAAKKTSKKRAAKKRAAKKVAARAAKKTSKKRAAKKVAARAGKKASKKRVGKKKARSVRGR
jgi:CheY-like chemotaxis protein